MKVRRVLERPGGPVRTCLACRTRLLKQDLLRFGADRTGRLEVDSKKNLPGRGVYCCPRPECLAILAGKKGKILKALRLDKIDCGLVARLADEYKAELSPARRDSNETYALVV